jgi:hypothetical protein
MILKKEWLLANYWGGGGAVAGADVYLGGTNRIYPPKKSHYEALHTLLSTQKCCYVQLQ